jgi:hypothetical protein
VSERRAASKVDAARLLSEAFLTPINSRPLR